MQPCWNCRGLFSTGKACAGASLRPLLTSAGNPRRLATINSLCLSHSLKQSFPSAPAGRGCKLRKREGRRNPAVRAMFRGIGQLVKGDPARRVAKLYQPKVDEINALEPQMQKLSDEELRAKTGEFKARVAQGEGLDDLLVEAFAVAREASTRVLGLRPFDVQLVGGIVLHEGRLAEMRTGEGKTLVAVLPAYLNALSGTGVQIVTVNDYLARRDSEWVGQVHRFLGMDVGLIQAEQEPSERYKAYQADVTYVTNSELGFDFLRDNMALVKEGLVLRDFNFAIVDEVDSVLIDEARTPLIISGSAEAPSDKYYKAAKLADALQRGEEEGPGVHYKVDEKQKSILLTEEGYEAAEDVLGVSDLYEPKEQWASYLINAVKAKELHFKDVNYIVRKGEIIIVDEFTGRTMPGRRWSDGLHQAIEAKEGVSIQNESVTLASISYQIHLHITSSNSSIKTIFKSCKHLSLFRSFPKLAGMTGTAATESEEFSRIYELEVTQIPTNMPVNRTDSSDVVFRNTHGKWGAVVKEVKRMNKQGRPVLVGTTSVEQSEELAEQLGEEGLTYQLLNAKPENVERESEIVAQSGRKGSITIATNMAGRGTDIILGGNPEYMARLYLRSLLMPEVVNQSAAIEEKAKGRAQKTKSWAVSKDLFPCQLSPDTVSQAKEAVNAAKQAWGERNLEELDAEERLSVACEKAPTNDAVTQQLRQAFKAMEREFKAVTDEEKQEVIQLGGLHVIGTERHEARRVDNQLRGRSGRQGDPGSTRFFLSLDDNMFRIFGGDRIRGMMSMFQIEDVPIESRMLTNALDEAQRKVESYFFDMRRNLFDFDQVLNTQRNKVYATRRQALLADELSATVIEFAEKTADDILEANVDAKQPSEQWPLDKLCERMAIFCYLVGDLTPDLIRSECGDDFEEIRYYLRERIVDAYKKKKAEADAIEPGMMQQAQQFFLLSQTDNLWQEHLQAMKFLQTAIGLRGYAQRDPLTEYKLEGYTLFLDMMARIRRNVIYNVFVFDAGKVKANTQARDSMLQRQVQDGNGKSQQKKEQPEPEPAGSAVKI